MCFNQPITLRTCQPSRYIPRSFRRIMFRRFCIVIYIIALTHCCLMTGGVCAQNKKPNSQAGDLTNLSLDQLMSVEVTSVSKKEEKLFQAAAAVHVITQEDIRRSGMTSIPDLLRLVPGLDVAQIDGSKWAVSARGFNGRIANKLLVLVDGRSVYSPETSGVYWDVQDLLLEDIERIEVIRGPGGTLWGANAVNGVINIITKHSEHTQGGLITAGFDSVDRGFGSIRYGSKAGENGYYRVYGKYFNRGGLVDATGKDMGDDQSAVRGGGRLDLQVTKRDSLMLEGELYRTDLHENPTSVSLSAPFAPTVNRPGLFSGGYVLGRWVRTFSERSDMALQLYYDRFNRDIFQIGGSIDTFDADFQHHIAAAPRQDFVWGIGARLINQKANDAPAPTSFNPRTEKSDLFNIFLQDKITLIQDKLDLTVGTKVERSQESREDAKFQLQPSVRILWTPQSHQTFWAAVSRAVRTPARSDTDIRGVISALPGPDGIPLIPSYFGNEEFVSETVIAYEAGYRVKPHRKVLLDIASFYNFYDHLQTFEPGAPFYEAEPHPHVIIPVIFSNLARAKTYGLETSVNLNVNSAWRLAGSYSFMRTQLDPYAKSLDANVKQATEGTNPEHQFQLHSFLKLKNNVELDASLYCESSLPYQQAPRYARLDIRFGWHLGEGFEISAGGRNLLDGHHQEFSGANAAVLTSEVKRSAFVKLSWQF